MRLKVEKQKLFSFLAKSKKGVSNITIAMRIPIEDNIGRKLIPAEVRKVRSRVAKLLKTSQSYPDFEDLKLELESKFRRGAPHA